MTPKPLQAAIISECGSGWRCITGRPFAEPPILDHKGMVAGRLGPITWFAQGDVEGERDGWISDSRLRRLFEKNIELGYEWRDECTEMILVQNYREWAEQMKKEESTHERRKLFHQLQLDLVDGEELDYEYKGMEEVMTKARKSGVVTNLGIWEFEHLDEDGGTKDIEEKLKARKDIFKIPSFGVTESPYDNWRLSSGEPFYRGVGARPAAEKYVHLAPPTWQAFLRKRYRLTGWEKAKLDDPMEKGWDGERFVQQYDPALEQLWKDEEDAASYWWWGTEMRNREKETKIKGRMGERFESPKSSWELDDLAIVKPTFKFREEFMPATYERKADGEISDQDEDALKLDEERIAETYKLSALFGRPAGKIDSVPIRIKNLISAREKVATEDFLSQADILDTFKMFSQSDSLVLKYLDLKTPKENEPAKPDTEIKAWLVGKLGKYRADAEIIAKVKERKRAAWEANEFLKMDQAYEAKQSAKREARRAAQRGIVERTKEAARSWVPFL